MKLVSASHLVQYNNFPCIVPKFSASKLQFKHIGSKGFEYAFDASSFPWTYFTFFNSIRNQNFQKMENAYSRLMGNGSNVLPFL